MFVLYSIDHRQYVGPAYNLVGTDVDAAGLFIRQADAEAVASDLCVTLGPVATLDTSQPVGA